MVTGAVVSEYDERIPPKALSVSAFVLTVDQPLAKFPCHVALWGPQGVRTATRASLEPPSMEELSPEIKISCMEV
jgi:hypothetical protein